MFGPLSASARGGPWQEGGPSQTPSRPPPFRPPLPLLIHPWGRECLGKWVLLWESRGAAPASFGGGDHNLGPTVSGVVTGVQTGLFYSA